MPYTTVAKPTGTPYTIVGGGAFVLYDDAAVAYDDSITLYDGVDMNAYTTVSKPVGTPYTTVAKPT